MLEELKRQLTEYQISPITHQNFERIFDVYDSNQDFFMLTQGNKVTMENSLSDIDALPPNCEIEQKLYFGIFQNGDAVGICDLILNYPKQTSFWIGLLLVNSKLHGKKIGGKLVNAILDSAKLNGYMSAQLGVIDANIKAIAFWERHGFNIVRQSGNIVVMDRCI